MKNSCPNCGSIWSPGSEEWDWQQCYACGWPDNDGDYDEDDYREDEEERRYNELAELAASCKCGAWQFAKDGSVVHVADCCCGAE